MDFLVSVQPAVDWKNRVVTVLVGEQKFVLPTTTIGSVEIRDDNSFAGLQIDSDDVVHTPSEDSGPCKGAAQKAVMESCVETTTGAENCPVPRRYAGTTC